MVSNKGKNSTFTFQKNHKVRQKVRTRFLLFKKIRKGCKMYLRQKIWKNRLKNLTCKKG